MSHKYGTLAAWNRSIDQAPIPPAPAGGGAATRAQLHSLHALGKAPPEHPLIALVRSFVGKPGDVGPVWGALMRVQARLGDNDIDGAKDAANDLEEALNSRLGQMHDALGRDTASPK